MGLITHSFLSDLLAQKAEPPVKEKSTEENFFIEPKDNVCTHGYLVPLIEAALKTEI